MSTSVEQRHGSQKITSSIMSLPILKTCKKRKRAPKLYSLQTFCDPGCPINPNGPFRDNIRVFLQECAETEDYHVNSMPVWCTLLVQESKGIVVPLYTIEETVSLSKHPFCDHCRCTGWSHHYVSKRKYHFIIPLDSEWNKPLSDDVFEVQTHLLYGLIHCNGFGHLLCINGIEGGSKYLSGRETMDLWDRICTNLHARKITVEDTSRKGSMELRLLHGIAYGYPWFGRWGYKFCHGSFGVQKCHYQSAVDILCSVDLDDLVFNLPNADHSEDIRRIISSCRNLSKMPLVTLRDILRFMLTLKSQIPTRKNMTLANATLPVSLPSRCSTKIILQNRHPPSKAKPIKCKTFASMIASMDSRWPTRRLEYAAEVIVNALKENCQKHGKSCGMPRQDVRDAARLYIGDTGLLDYVLKSMNNVIVGNFVVQRQLNQLKRILEYTIRELGEASPTKPDRENASESASGLAKESAFDVHQDVHIFYKKMLLGQPESEAFGLAVRVILDSKHFVKEWPFKDMDDQLLRYICHALPTSSELDMELSRDFSPGELVILPLHASLGELKLAAQHALRDSYCIMENYTVSEIVNLESLINEDAIFGEVESGAQIWVRGRGINLQSELRYEGGPDNWTVRCSCGAEDDDGERMVSCDICEVWQHTRCRGIEDSETVPPLFVCHKCCSSLVPPRAEPLLQPENSQDTGVLPAADESWIMPILAEVEEPWMMLQYPCF